MRLTYEDKIDIMKSLNWDYLDNPDDMLSVLEGRLVSSGSFKMDKLFVRSLENLPWHYVVALWGVENIIRLYTDETAKRIWPKERKRHFDYAVAALRGDPLPSARWGDEHFKQMQHAFLSDRWHGAK